VIAKIEPSVEQIRWYAQAALNGFETLDLETAAEMARGNLRSLLLYLEAFDNADNTIVVSLVGGVKQVIEPEGLVRDTKSGD
jgi:hypothetical protein